jgi:hypothetical protein
MRALRLPMLGRCAVLAALLGGCVTQRECDLRVDRARARAVDDASACVFDPDALLAPTCGGADRRPYLTYVAAWCEAAALPCVRDLDGAYATCFGAGPDTGLGALQTP